MKLFGEYLVEQGLVKKNELLEILLEQVNQIPTMAECIYKGKLLSEDDLLEALKYQSAHYVDLLTALKSTGKWNEVLEKKVKKSMTDARVPLGQLLATKGVIKFEELVKHLDDFMYENKKVLEDRASNKEVKGAENMELASKLAVQTKGSVESAPVVQIDSDFVSIDKNLLEGFFEIFNETTLQKMNESLEELSEGTADALIAQYNAILLGARFIQASLVEKLSEELVFSVKYVIDAQKSDSVHLVRSANDLLTNLYGSLKESGGEAQFWSSQELQNQYNELLEVLSNCRASEEEDRCVS